MSKQITCVDDTRYHYSHLSINKSRLKEFNAKNSWYSNSRNYYLDDGAEFQVELFNPTQDPIAASISINGKSIGSSLLVIYPGQRIWLERDFDSKNKFKFIVYEVDANDPIVEEAIKENGIVKIEFFKECRNVEHISTYIYPSNPNPWMNPWSGVYWNNASTAYDDVIVDKAYNTSINKYPDSSITTCISGDILGTPAVSSINYCSTDISASTVNSNATLTYTSASTHTIPTTTETGIVGRSANKSKQNFKDVNNIDFNTFPFRTETLHIYPISQKQMTIEDTNIRRYCTKCGKKLKQSFKYCPVCGTKIE